MDVTRKWDRHVLRHGEPHTEEVLLHAQFTSGSFFGEESLIHDAVLRSTLSLPAMTPRRAREVRRHQFDMSAAAVCNSTLYTVLTDDFVDVLTEFPEYQSILEVIDAKTVP